MGKYPFNKQQYVVRLKQQRHWAAMRMDKTAGCVAEMWLDVWELFGLVAKQFKIEVEHEEV